MNLFNPTDMLRKLISLSFGLTFLLALVAFAGCNRHKEDSTGNVMRGSVIGTEGYFGASINMTKEAVFDKDPLTMFDAPLGEGCWVGMDFDKPVHPAKITYLGRGDGNSIEKGDLYELSYFKNGGWHSLGKKIATEGHFDFDGVPKNALLYLRDLSKGQEDRIFTYENGQQVWR